MPRLLPILAVLGAIAALPASAQRQCAAATDQAQFEVQALRSHLMVLATSCDNESGRYAAFINKYQRDLNANDQAVTAWFKKRYGGRGQAEHDRYITDLANAVSTGSTVLGGDLCPHDGMMFAEVMALRGPADLASYAAAKDLVPPSLDACPGQQPVAAKPAAKAAPAKK